MMLRAIWAQNLMGLIGDGKSMVACAGGFAAF